VIRAERRGDVAVLTLDRAEKRNALVPEMLEQLRSAAEAAAAERARAVLLLGEGRAFCAGFDLELCATAEGAVERLLDELGRTVAVLRGLACPVVAGVQGAAVAGGCALLGGADVVVAERSAKFGYPVLRIGVSPAVSLPFLRRHAGDGPARSRALDPGLIDAGAALALGLAHEVVDDGAAAEHSLACAADLAAKPGVGAIRTRDWLNTIEGWEGDAQAGLRTSLGLAGGEEERTMLARAWAPQRRGSARGTETR